MSHASELPPPPSATALRVAALRALHEIKDHAPVFVDPLARRILRPLGPSLLDGYHETAADTAPLRATLAARGAFAAKACDEAVADGVRQVAILGAGLDTFAYRPSSVGLQVFEVDQPAMQRWKRELMRRAAIDVPPSVTFVAADIGGALAALLAAGYAPTEPTLFLMQGVSFYVAKPTLLDLFIGIGTACAPGTSVVFDYSEALDRAPAESRARYRAAATRVAAGGEPWITFFAPDEIADALRRGGLAVVEDVDARAQNARWFDGRPDGLQVVPLAHLVHARVVGASTARR